MNDPDITYAWLGPILRVEKDEKDPTIRYIYGKATDDSVDTDEQIVDAAFARKALAEWYDTGANVRQMHATTLPPAGKGVLLEHKEGDGEWVRTKVVEPTAVKLVDEGVYSGYSVGIARPRIDRDMKARGGRIVGGKIVEISLVDRPALPTAKFAVVKRAKDRGPWQYIGKVVTLGEPVAAVRGPKVVKQLQKGMHVTAHVRNGETVEAIEGRVLSHTQHGFTLDVRGFAADGSDERPIDRGDVVAIYKGAAPVLKVRIALDGAQVAEAVRKRKGGFAPGHQAEDSVDDDKSKPKGKPFGKPKDAAPAADPDADADAAGGNDQDADDAPVDKAAAVACTNCGGNEFDGDKCHKCGTMKGAAPDVAKGADEPPMDGPAAEKVKRVRVEERDGGFAVVKGDKVVGGPFPTEDEATTNFVAFKAARKTIAAEKAAKRTAAKAEKAAKRGAIRAEKAAKTVNEVPWLVRRLHDYTCAAYDDSVVAATYPSATKGDIFGGTRSALYETMQREITEGSPVTVAGLAKAIAAANDLRTAQKRGGKEVRKAIAAAHAELHSVFKFANGLTEASPDGLPKPGESVAAGQFKRPYLRSGHQDPGGSGHGAASIPQTTHPVHASDFGRGALTEGHQRYLSAKLADLHDGLSSWRPEICRMDAKGSMAFDRQPVGAQRGDEAMLAFKAVDNQSTSVPTPRELGKTKRAPGEKVAKPKATKTKKIVKMTAGEPTVTADQIREIVVAAQAPLLLKIGTLETNVEELASAPDTSRSALRGVTGIRGKIDKAAGSPKAQSKAAREDKKAEKIEFFRSLAVAGDPDQRIRAADWLASHNLDA